MAVIPLFDHHKKQALFWKFGGDLFRWSQEMEQYIQFWCYYRAVPPLFNLHKNEPCSESLEQISLDGVKNQNKTYNFEVSIGLLALSSIVMKKLALFWKFGADSFRWSHKMEQNIQFWSQYRVVTPLFDCHKNEPCSESLEQMCLDGVGKLNKTYSFEVSIQTIYIKKFPQLTITCLITT